MIAWGGSAGINRLDTGGRYNPGTDSWVNTSVINAPTGRYSHTAVWTGNEMIVWGGYNGTDVPVRVGDTARNLVRHPHDSYADTEPYSYAMHREMHTNAKAASTPAPRP